MRTIAVLYPGDMGSHVAKALIDNGFRVVSYLEGRSDDTKKNAETIGMENLASLEEIASVSDLVISLVPPRAVKPVAMEYIAAAYGMDNPARFVDMNAKSIATAFGLSGMFIGASLPFTNAAIIGRAANIVEEGIIYTSGDRSEELDTMLGEVFRVEYLDNNVAAATTFKMCFAGFNKTISSAIFEIAAASNRFGITDRLFEQITEKMPGLVSDIGSLIGNYPKHLSRRRQEMEELARTLNSVSLPNYIAVAAAQTLAEIEKQKNFDAYKDDPNTPFLTLIKAIRA